jgi:hypothetical protein
LSRMYNVVRNLRAGLARPLRTQRV